MTDFLRRRIRKDSPEIRAVGALDEASVAVGVARSFSPDLNMVLVPVQRDLWRIMGEFSTGQADPELPANAKWLETVTNQYSAEILPLHGFVVPGETAPSAMLDLARVAVRQAEREGVGQLRPESVRYLNRLSSLLFVLGRRAEQQAGVPPRYAKEFA